MHQLEAFAKIPRFFRDVTISEKIDGTTHRFRLRRRDRQRGWSRSRWITRKRTTSGFRGVGRRSCWTSLRSPARDVISK